MEKISIQRVFYLRLFILIPAFLFSIVLPSVEADAFQPTPSDDDVNAIAQQLFCPVCENIPLDVCDTEACRQWRDLIRKMLAEGKTEEEIINYFSETYGIRVLSEPPIEGFNWLVYIVPPLAFLLGILFLYKALRSWRQMTVDTGRKNLSGSKPPEIDNPYITRIEDELKKN